MSNRHIDYLGNIIKVGDLCVWPNRQGSSMWMNRGYVLALGFDGGTGMPVRHDPILQVKRQQFTALHNLPTGKYRNVTLTDLSRVVTLGRVRQFEPKKEQTNEVVDNIRFSMFDKIMGWFRGAPKKKKEFTWWRPDPNGMM